jgi:hypothetical protein
MWAQFYLALSYTSILDLQIQIISSSSCLIFIFDTISFPKIFAMAGAGLAAGVGEQE